MLGLMSTGVVTPSVLAGGVAAVATPPPLPLDGCRLVVTGAFAAGAGVAEDAAAGVVGVGVVAVGEDVPAGPRDCANRLATWPTVTGDQCVRAMCRLSYYHPRPYHAEGSLEE